MTESNNIIETFDLTKIFTLKDRKKEITALDHVNLSIKEGEIFGLLGPNGAGKTTLIHILTTIKQPTSGYAIIDGINLLKKPKESKSRIALMLDNKMLYFRITGYDNLKFFCKIYNIPNYKKRINRIAEEFEFKKWLSEYVENYSGGMKMKLALMRTFLLNRKIIFLDEPTLGLDVKVVSFIIEKIQKSGKTILLTSHDMRVVEKLCDRIAFINNGKILKVGTQEDIKSLMQKEIKLKVLLNGSKNQLKDELYQHDFIKEVSNMDGGLMIGLKNRDYYADLFQILSKYKIRKFNESEMSLEDLFLKLN